MTKSMEFVPKGIVKMISMQSIAPYCSSEGVDELLRAFPGQTTRDAALYMYMLGYIDGKRADRARRRKGQIRR